MKITKKNLTAALILVCGVFIILFMGKIVEDARKDKNYVCQMPVTGAYHVWTNGGLQWQLFGHVEEYNKTSQVNFSGFNDSDNTVNAKIVFNDSGKGVIIGSFRVILPEDADHMMLIQQQYHNEHRLLSELCSAQLLKAVTATGPLMSSLQSVSETRTQLYEYILDQINYGVYATKSEKIEVKNDITGEMEIRTVNVRVADPNAPNGWKRQESAPFAKYGIVADNLVISDIAYDETTQNQIDSQKSANLSIITAKTKAVEAQQRTIEIEERGKQEAAQAKWNQEKIKAAEITKAEQEYEVARLAALKAKEEAKRIEAEGRAKAEANRLLVAAGLTPLEKATIEKETAIGIAQALANSHVSWVPEIMIGGSNGSSTAMDAIGLNMLMEISKNLNKK